MASLIYSIQSNQVETLPKTTPLNLTVYDSGKILLLPGTLGAGQVINLPGPGNSYCYKFLVLSTMANACAITATGGAVINGACTTNKATANTVVSFTNAGSVSFTAAAVKGDWLEIFSDGTGWYCNGLSGAAAANGFV